MSRQLSRKQLLIAGGAAGAAAAVGGGIVHESRSGAAPAPTAAADQSPTVPFHGVHQAGFTESVAGLLFLGYQRDPRAQFVPIQTRLAAEDRLNEYIQHVSSAVWAVLPGVEHRDGYLGQTLFEA